MTDTQSTPNAASAETAAVVVVGSGIAGCSAALAAAREGVDVLLLTKATKPDDASTDWAQGGISTTRGDPAALTEDIIAASDGTADPDAVDILVEHADAAVEDVLIDTLDIGFDETDSGEFDYAREAAHSESRILHVDAATGTHILRPFLNHVDDHERIEVRQDTAALELITHEGRVYGVVTDEAPDGHPIYAGTTILATGGIGALYSRSTNPDDATGDGIAMAALAGADVADLEYVQFHPTASDCEARSASKRSGGAAKQDTFLLSEALRGEGALLRNADGDRFMPDYHPDAELAPRDVVARAVETEREATGEVVLDVSPLEFDAEFPTIAAKCRDRGIEGDEIPVAPCEHFLCGGIAVDDRGRTSLDRLYAVGECARTGVHGANRLASTSLLEGLVWGLRAGEDAAGVGADPDHTVVDAPDLLNRDPDLPERFATEKFARLQRTMDEYLGLERNPEEIARAGAVLRRLKGEVDAYIRTRTARDLYELRNASVVALLIARAASENAESVGCHYVVEDEREPEQPHP
ncbi:fumarate reductase/succinate dehydrogenase flavoprotein domain-containing protein [Natrialba chahannaoensis JCM 10990]|uniref:L-aspartate oxidase n=1 Tax=Natrialba chahannaoensis JCM 10990 TaxID=1227492 RepID=M0A357_9EURY|nr:FAD-dependent oxidoreductase [Natrialba chahannaoensis]ELY93004.1 fumarate reductase/succinate dehydrogenase flavoprotein domain-containing protein [Natrialba chahannaoensis JCM 10990]